MNQFSVLCSVPEEDIYMVMRFEYAEGWAPMDSIRDAIRQYLTTKEGKTALRENNDDFNWGDSPVIPDRIWKKFGLKLVECFSIDQAVDHDENLNSDDTEEDY